MRSSHTVDRVDTAFDDDRLVADAGLLLPATLAAHLGLRELVERHLDLGARPGAANVGDKLLTLVMSALAGGDHIDHVDARDRRSLKGHRTRTGPNRGLVVVRAASRSSDSPPYGSVVFISAEAEGPLVR